MHSEAEIEAREATIEDAADIHGLACELAETVGDALPAEEAVRKHEAGTIELVATTANVAAREFYRSLGFVEADVVALEFVGSNENPPQPEE